MLSLISSYEAKYFSSKFKFVALTIVVNYSSINLNIGLLPGPKIITNELQIKDYKSYKNKNEFQERLNIVPGNSQM